MLEPLRHVVRSFARRIAGPDPIDTARARLILGPDEIERYPHRFDLMATMHNDGFRKDPVFAAAYERAIQAGGWDYGVPWRVHQHLWAADRARRVEGDVVELGTARGFFMSAVLAAWPGWAESSRSLHLFDMFDPVTVGVDGASEHFARFYTESIERTQRNFAEWPRVHFYRGDVFETLPAAPIDRIAFLHIDLNHPDPETFGLRHLWDRVSVGGVVLLDDYAYYSCEDQYEAMNALAAELGFSILSTPVGQGIIVK
jgi:hypothetical protein